MFIQPKGPATSELEDKITLGISYISEYNQDTTTIPGGGTGLVINSGTLTYSISIFSSIYSNEIGIGILGLQHNPSYTETVSTISGGGISNNNPKVCSVKGPSTFNDSNNTGFRGVLGFFELNYNNCLTSSVSEKIDLFKNL